MFLNNNAVRRLLILVALSVLGLPAGADERSDKTNHPARPENSKKYAFATQGLVEIPHHLRLLLDESNLGGKELEMAEMTFAAGEVDGNHQHGSVEIFYVLSGSLGHEVNGELHWLKPGMVGVVRPGDTVRHIAPKDSDVKVLVIWAPTGEAKRIGITVPLHCSFPQVATYKGKGELSEAKNFECKDRP